MLDIKNQSAEKSAGKITMSRYTKATSSVTLEGSMGGRVAKRIIEAVVGDDHNGKKPGRLDYGRTC